MEQLKDSVRVLLETWRRRDCSRRRSGRKKDNGQVKSSRDKEQNTWTWREKKGDRENRVERERRGEKGSWEKIGVGKLLQARKKNG